MKTAPIIAAVLLISCARVQAPEESALLRTVPSRAVAVMHFSHCERALEFLLDSTSVFRQLDYGRLGDEEMILSGVESRTSSPVRIRRDARFEGSLRGLYPCGEGAGYAGGITSAAMDGLKVAEAVIKGSTD